MITPAVAQPVAKPSAASLPVSGEVLPLSGAPTWPKLDQLYDVPAPADAAGKVVIHWFCAPKVKTCADDLARIVTMKENGHVYVVAYINGTKVDAKKLDPIRESEGVGQGSVAFGRGVATLMKQLSVVGPASIIVDLEGKVALVSTGSSPQELDTRDAKVNSLIAGIKDYTATSDSPKSAKPGEKFAMSISIKLASWLKYSKKAPMTFKLTAPPDFKCDATSLKDDQLKMTDQTLTAQVSCSAPKGVYEARGQINFGYDAPSGGTGLGTESANYKLEVKP